MQSVNADSRSVADSHTRSNLPPVWIGILLSLAVCAIVVIPWASPSPEVVVSEFVPELITIDPKGFLPRPGIISVGTTELELLTTPHSQPTVHLVTAEVPFSAEFSVSVLNWKDAFPFQMKVWNPRSGAAIEVWYAPDGTVNGATRSNARWGQIRQLGQYRLGDMRIWRVERSDRWVTFEIQGGPERVRFEVGKDTFPDLFGGQPVSLTLYASAPTVGSSAVVVRNPYITVPHQRRYGTGVDSRWFRPVVGAAALLSLLWTVAWARSRLLWRISLPSLRVSEIHARELAVAFLVAATSLALGWNLSKLPGYPYDVRSLVVWTWIAREHGPAAVPGYSLLATPGDAWSGQPYAAATYPYPPVPQYLFWLVGKIARGDQTEQAFKMVSTSIVLVGGIVLYSLLRRLRVSKAMAVLTTGAYVFNPAILFDSAIWGQTDSLLALFLLLGVAGIITESASLTWCGILLAFLTKQTGALLAPVLMALGIFRLGTRRFAGGLPSAVLVVFLVLTPLFLAGLHPSATYRPFVTKALEFGTIRSMDPANAVVSQTAFTLWSAVTGLTGLHGWAQQAFPDYVATPFGLSYFTLSRVVFALFVFTLTFILFRARGAYSPGVVFLTVAAYAVAAAVLLTRVHARYLYFGVLFAVASQPWMPRALGIATLGALTGSMLVAMWGVLVFTSVWYPGLLPVFEPERSWLNGAMANALGSGIGITLGGLLNTAALLALLAVLWKHRTGSRAER